MVLLLRSLFISLTLVALSLDDILILHAFNAKKLFIKRQLMFIRGNTLQLQYIILPVRYVLALRNMPWQGAIHRHYAIGTVYVHQALEVGIETIYRLYCPGTLHWRWAQPYQLLEYQTCTQWKKLSLIK